jgi:hypothetical protein
LTGITTGVSNSGSTTLMAMDDPPHIFGPRSFEPTSTHPARR